MRLPMRKLVLTAAMVAIGFASAANAADMPTKAPIYKAPPAVVAPYNWTGFYLGVNGGYGWGQTTGDILPAFFGGNYDINGGLFGGQIGFNYQLPASPLVLGIEADWDWTDIKGSQTVTLLRLPVSDSVKVENLGTVRGRIGYAWDRFLVYGTGGWAWSSRVSAFCSSCIPTDDSHSLNGYTVGGGVEYGFTPNLSVKAEYLYAHLEPVDFFQNAGCTVTCSLGANVNVVRLGLNWRFTGSPF